MKWSTCARVDSYLLERQTRACSFLIPIQSVCCLVETCTLNMYLFMAYIGFTRRNMLFVFWWQCHRNT